MSGGAFDYAYCRVSAFADDLDARIESCDEVDTWGGTPNKFSPPVLEKLREIERQVRHTSDLMREVEWLYSGDIGEESFMRRVAAIEDGN